MIVCFVCGGIRFCCVVGLWCGGVGDFFGCFVVCVGGWCFGFGGVELLVCLVLFECGSGGVCGGECVLGFGFVGLMGICCDLFVGWCVDVV